MIDGRGKSRDTRPADVMPTINLALAAQKLLGHKDGHKVRRWGAGRFHTRGRRWLRRAWRCGSSPRGPRCRDAFGSQLIGQVAIEVEHAQRWDRLLGQAAVPPAPPPSVALV